MPPQPESSKAPTRHRQGRAVPLANRYSRRTELTARGFLHFHLEANIASGKWVPETGYPVYRPRLDGLGSAVSRFVAPPHRLAFSKPWEWLAMADIRMTA